MSTVKGNFSDPDLNAILGLLIKAHISRRKFDYIFLLQIFIREFLSKFYNILTHQAYMTRHIFLTKEQSYHCHIWGHLAWQVGIIAFCVYGLVRLYNTLKVCYVFRNRNLPSSGEQPKIIAIAEIVFRISGTLTLPFSSLDLPFFSCLSFIYYWSREKLQAHKQSTVDTFSCVLYFYLWLSLLNQGRICILLIHEILFWKTLIMLTLFWVLRRH